jgi:hypothetical protein
VLIARSACGMTTREGCSLMFTAVQFYLVEMHILDHVLDSKFSSAVF